MQLLLDYLWLLLLLLLIFHVYMFDLQFWYFWTPKFGILHLSNWIMLFALFGTSCIELNQSLFIPAELKIKLVKKSFNWFPSLKVCLIIIVWLFIMNLIRLISIAIDQDFFYVPSIIFLRVSEPISNSSSTVLWFLQCSNPNLMATTYALRLEPFLIFLDLV